MGATKEELESWHRDKAVKDSLVESRLCVDCGVNTAPGFPDGPTARIEIALYGKSIMRFSCENEVYHVRNHLARSRHEGLGRMPVHRLPRKTPRAPLTAT